jgi:type IV secretion system protein VirB9
MRLIVLFLVSLFSFPALSATDPKAGALDPRVRYLDYKDNDVVRLFSHIGYQIHVVLQDGEYVLPKSVFPGDAGAWTFATAANNIFFKPKANNGSTNITVLTNLRSYTFFIEAAVAPEQKLTDDMLWKVVFRYPDDDKAQAARRIAEQKQLIDQAVKEQELKRRLENVEAIKNWNYFVQGSESLSPDEAYDDGRFTYLKFKGNRDIPAIFIVNEDGSESLINRHVDKDTVIIQSLAKKFVLRKGKAVACVFNESFDPIGNDNDSGTTIPGIKRVLKESTGNESK